jgi:hypothetical protein
MFKMNPLRKRQFRGSLLGLGIGIAAILFLSRRSSEEYISLGPMNTGHEALSCVTCHADARGTLNQQLQSNISHMMGFREKGVEFGSMDVRTDNCLQCHDRPNDRHPTDRFTELRFREVIKTINTTSCITCHTEHRDQRLTIRPVNYCMNCHQDLEVENDPVDVPHTTLAATEQWSSCIQCHDFHGNHRYKVPVRIQDTIPLKALQAYFDGGPDPFGDNKKYQGLSEPEWLKTLEK